MSTDDDAGRLTTQPRCWQCGELLDGYTAGSGAPTPRPGDASLCLYCGALATFDLAPVGLMTLRRPTIAEQEVFQLDPDLARARDWIRRRRPRPMIASD